MVQGLASSHRTVTVERVYPPSSGHLLWLVVNRTYPDHCAKDERTALTQWLDYHRATLAVKVEDLTDSQARARTTPSPLSLLGLVRHMADVERWWFRIVLAGETLPHLYWTTEDPDGDFNDVSSDTLSSALRAWHEEVDSAKRLADKAQDLSTAATAPDGRIVDVRWIFIHMIEEYSRHNGHADIIRESLDGRTGE